MYSKKKGSIQIDPEQRALIEHAHKRISQKKRLFQHFILFVIGSVFLLVLNLLIGYGKSFTLFGSPWSYIAICVWAFVFMIHCCDVWLFSKFIGKDWKDAQLEKLVSKQKKEIALLQKDVDQMYPKEALVKQKENFIATSTVSKMNTKAQNNRVITMIAAAGENNELGKDNDLVWHLPDDFKRFKKLTTGHHIIMGRKTLDSFPKLLPNRTHIAITRDKQFKREGVLVAYSLEDALALVKNDSKPFIIGGGEIYKLGLKVADAIELTRVHGSFEADAFFPEIDLKNWEVVNEEFHDIDDKHKYSFTYVTYHKI